MSTIETKWREEIETAIKRAYGLGQLYSQQADSESYRENAKSDKTRATFQELLAQSVANANAAIATKDAEIAGLRAACNLFAEALDLALDGEQDHDIDPGPTGMTQEQCDLVISARAAARKFLKEGK